MMRQPPLPVRHGRFLQFARYPLDDFVCQERALRHPPSSVPQMSCPFAKLGLPPSASQDDVKAAYRLLGA